VLFELVASQLEWRDSPVDAEDFARQGRSDAPGRRRAFAHHSIDGWVRRFRGISSPLGLPISGQHLGSLSGCGRSRDGPPRGGLGRFPAWQTSRSVGKEAATVRCSSSFEWASAPLRASWLVGSRPARVVPPLVLPLRLWSWARVARCRGRATFLGSMGVKACIGRGSVVGSVCSGSVFWL
jgi:hypothetical protein